MFGNAGKICNQECNVPMFHKFLFEGWRCWRISHGTCRSQSLHEAPCLFNDQLQAGIHGVVNGNGALLASQNLWCCSATVVPFNGENAELEATTFTSELSPQCLYLLDLLYSTHSICWQYQSAMCFCSFFLSTSKMHACHILWQQRCMLKDRNQFSVPAW